MVQDAAGDAMSNMDVNLNDFVSNAVVFMRWALAPAVPPSSHCIVPLQLDNFNDLPNFISDALQQMFTSAIPIKTVDVYAGPGVWGGSLAQSPAGT